MADINDVRATKAARSELGRRGVDMTHGDVRVLHGVVYISGAIRAIVGSGIGDVRSELELIARILKTKPEIKDVVINCTYRS
jgi:hypothetical protein